MVETPELLLFQTQPRRIPSQNAQCSAEHGSCIRIPLDSGTPRRNQHRAPGCTQVAAQQHSRVHTAGVRSPPKYTQNVLSRCVNMAVSLALASNTKCPPHFSDHAYTLPKSRNTKSPPSFPGHVYYNTCEQQSRGLPERRSIISNVPIEVSRPH